MGDLLGLERMMSMARDGILVVSSHYGMDLDNQRRPVGEYTR